MTSNRKTHLMPQKVLKRDYMIPYRKKFKQLLNQREFDIKGDDFFCQIG